MPSKLRKLLLLVSNLELNNFDILPKDNHVFFIYFDYASQIVRKWQNFNSKNDSTKQILQKLL